ncbi:substrate-binding domain-containing protein [Streptococcus iniae]|uniref:Phosphate ABC transporter substrate-binding protein n=1 Tax=Streptococcus iniae TaxID=1346 RepID=A0A3L8JUV1_STRIN|nr:substrate-binding domain-containing protein [Streptococcus iniae]AJG26257.1 phosphate ABC transporter substrate-binding protein [Streptococcus iniae]ASL35085.1 lipoprotein [Streptococcus iniae]ATX40065.1 Phosphate-binding protein PstS 2 [Streptococcus iniae]EKB51608.1 phosphate ABC superfamily ATP binding cassette transporter, binding protein [Streptococcus iniae 9117]ELY5747459.1 substrate-binding domain-containing protein [Streptococcus iniae]
MKMTKMLSLVALSVTAFGLAACGNNSSQSSATSSGKIEVITREDGSGTRGAFTEITGIKKKDKGKEIDNTSKSAVVQNSTEGVISAVSGNPQAVGYISLGSLNDHIKALKVDGVKASSQTVLDGEYPLQRPFNIVFTDQLSGLGKDFVSFIHSKEGQAVVSKNKFVEAKTEVTAYSSQKLSGKLSIVGSTSVAPLMEKLVEAYKKENPDVTIAITANGSSAGITATQEKTADIGMVSRELTPEEGKGLKHDAIALDGIAVVVNKDSKIDAISMKAIADVFTGKVNSWDKVN